MTKNVTIRGAGRPGRGLAHQVAGQEAEDFQRLRSNLEERLRFEALLGDLSTALTRVSAEQIDVQVEEALRRIGQFLGADRGSFGESRSAGRQFLITHSYSEPGIPAPPPMWLDDLFPWYAERIRQGEVLRFTRLPEGLPPEAAPEREYVARVGLKSNLTIPLKVCGSVVGVIGFGSLRQYRDWPEELVPRLQLLGAMIATAVARKQAEEALQAKEHRLRKARDDFRILARHLLQAQEEERRRIAREMHDDWTQRLAVLAFDTARMEQELELNDSARMQLEAMREKLVGLSEDVHALSRQLHPSILDDLGLADALLSECSGFARREGIAVDYRPESVPDRLPREVALCVYRVAQEALRNIARHARVNAARVVLTGTGEELVLSVEDEGVGFDPAAAHARPALGLSSMEERVRLIQAELCVRSAPGRGTTVTVKVPLTGRES